MTPRAKGVYDCLRRKLKKQVNPLPHVDYVSVLEKLACDIEGWLDAKRKEMDAFEGAEDCLGERDDW